VKAGNAVSTALWLMTFSVMSNAGGSGHTVAYAADFKCGPLNAVYR